MIILNLPVIHNLYQLYFLKNNNMAKAYKKKKKLSKQKAAEMLHDGTAHGHKLTEQQRKYFGAVKSGYAANGLANTDMGMGGGGGMMSGAPNGASDPNSGTQQQQAPQISVMCALSMSANGQQTPIGNLEIKAPEDIKKLVQMIAGVFQQAQGGQQGQPAAQPQPQPQP
jgi:hypothetical protein